jgi:hypothetical protein
MATKLEQRIMRSTASATKLMPRIVGRYAMIVAISKYQDHCRRDNLPNSKLNATSIRQRVELQDMGFTVPDWAVLLDHDATRDNVLQVLDRLLTEARQSTHSIVMFYFSGHGAEIGGQMYLVPFHTLTPEEEATVRELCSRLGEVAL